jgi:hypothetical protein
MVFSFFKKAQGMSINVIIVAVIGLVVLVVLVLIMTGKTKIFSAATASCATKGAGAHCIATAEEKNCDGSVYKSGTDCPKINAGMPWCCVPIG